VSAAPFLTAEGLDPAALNEISREISLVESELLKQVQSQVQLVSDIGCHVLQAGGKRLRPAFLSLSAGATGLSFDRPRTRKLAACMEMIHMATLIHDDVIDNSGTRRGRSTANAVFGNTASILSGDVLLSKAMSILAQDGDIDIIRTVSSAVVDLAEGEVRELEVRNRFDLTEEEHIEILRMKTASFIQCCCEVGALATGAPDEVRDALGTYGHHVGLAFQIADDLLDYRGDLARTGKPKATDYKEGCATLPLIYLSSHLSDPERARAQQGFGAAATDADIVDLCQLMEARGAFQKAETRAREHLNRAQQALDFLPPTPDKTLLQTAAEYVIMRKS